MGASQSAPLHQSPPPRQSLHQRTTIVHGEHHDLRNPNPAVGEKRRLNAVPPGAPPSKRRSSAATIFSPDNSTSCFEEITPALKRDNDRLRSKMRELKEGDLTPTGHSDKASELEAQIGQLSAEKIALQEEIAQMHADMAIHASDLHPETRRLKIENADLKKRVQEMQLTNEDVESRARQATTEKAKLKEENARLSAKLDQIQRPLSDRPDNTSHQVNDQDLSHHPADDDSANLTPSPSNFPFSIAGEYMHDGQPTQLTLEQLSSELQDKVSDFPQEMETLWPQKWKERKSITEIAKVYQEGFSNQCLHKKCTKAGNSQWTVDDPRHYACGTCANQARLCFALRDGEIWLAPLPPDVAESNDPTELLHHVVHSRRKTKISKDKNMWRFWKSSQTAA